MLDLSAIDQATLLARGQYSTVRAAHEDGKSVLQVACGSGMSSFQQILKLGQSNNPDEVDEAMKKLDELLALMDTTKSHLGKMSQLAKQRQVLKVEAW